VLGQQMIQGDCEVGERTAVHRNRTCDALPSGAGTGQWGVVDDVVGHDLVQAGCVAGVEDGDEALEQLDVFAESARAYL
jgi:hypothetical protein